MGLLSDESWEYMETYRAIIEKEAMKSKRLEMKPHVPDSGTGKEENEKKQFVKNHFICYSVSNRSRPSVRHYALSSGLFWEMEANRFFCNLPGDWKCARASGGKICEIEEVQ